jgi:hypothetical protein
MRGRALRYVISVIAHHVYLKDYNAICLD